MHPRAVQHASQDRVGAAEGRNERFEAARIARGADECRRRCVGGCIRRAQEPTGDAAQDGGNQDDPPPPSKRCARDREAGVVQPFLDTSGVCRSGIDHPRFLPWTGPPHAS